MDDEIRADESREITLLPQAAWTLAGLTRVEEVKEIRDRAEAMRLYIKQQGEGLEAQNAAAELKLRAERRAGELLIEMEKARGGWESTESCGNIVLPQDSCPTYADLGINKMSASRWQSIARIPEPDFERYISETVAAVDELTTAGALRLAKQLVATPSVPRPWSLDAAAARLDNFLGSLLERSPEECRPHLVDRIRGFVGAVGPEVDDDPSGPEPDPVACVVAPPIPANGYHANGVGPDPSALRSPFPWFGSKARVAVAIWDRFGDVPNFVEPFAGSLAVLLGRPHGPQVETVNDINCFIANFFRAVARDPTAVAEHSRWPVNEADLAARHWWLTNSEEAKQFRHFMRTMPNFFDPLVAGWWAWGQCAWIGSGWCEHADAVDAVAGTIRPPRQARPDLGGTGKGLVSLARASTPGDDRLLAYLDALSARLRNVRVCCGDWRRICGPAPTTGLGITAVFLDPPYLTSAGRYPDLYASDSRDVAREVRDWAIANGDDPLFRIALCGYEGEHVMPDSWECFSWEATAGYAAPRRNGTNGNARRERIWFSPRCLRPHRDRTLFDTQETSECPAMMA